MDKHIFEVQTTKNKTVEKKSVIGVGSDEEKAKEDVFYQLCEGSNISKENIKILRLIGVG